MFSDGSNHEAAPMACMALCENQSYKDFFVGSCIFKLKLKITGDCGVNCN